MLERAAPKLEAALAQAEPYALRLSAQRLDDTRLEAQRAEAATALEAVVAAMRTAAAEAAAGRPTRFVEAVDDYSNAIADLRAAGEME